MNFFNYLICVLVVIAGVSISYKTKYHKNIAKAKKEPPIVHFLNNLFPSDLDSLLPLRQLPNNDEDNKLRKKANVALFVFYIDFAMIMLLSIWAK